MLDALFLSVLNMSITASLAILVVLPVRFLLKKAPKIFSYALWVVVLFRFLCPFSFESAVGLLPINATPIKQDIVFSSEPQINTGLNIVDDVVNSILPIPNNTEDSVNPLQIWVFAGSVIWATGILVMLIYSIIQFVRLKRKLIGAAPLRDNIHFADHITSPFVMGFMKPNIYLPSSMAETEQAFIIVHEKYHIKRLDHITRILGFIALMIHWFNPLAWIAFVLSGKDMEMSCDAAVLGKMGTDIRAEYSESLVRFATGRKIITATPLAFGEGDTKDRVKNVMKYKNPVLWVTAISIIVVICVVTGLATNKTKAKTVQNGTYNMIAEEHKIGGRIIINDAVFRLDKFARQVITQNQATELADFKAIKIGTEKNKIHEQFGEPHNTLFGMHGDIYIVEDKQIVIYYGFENEVSYLVTEVKISDYIPKKLTHDQAVTSALFSLGSHYTEGECIGEGHIILGYDDSNKDATKIYALTKIGWYGFENNNFVKVSGGASPAVITLNSDSTVFIEHPMDGSEYKNSIEEMFPKEFHERIFDYSDIDRENLKQQEEKYASDYLSKIGRDAKIGEYSDFEYTSLTDLGVSVETSNNIEVFYKEHNYYPSFIGTSEQIENGVRVIYEMSYEKNQDEIKFLKYNYDTKEIIEQVTVNAITGEFAS